MNLLLESTEKLDKNILKEPNNDKIYQMIDK